MALKFQGDRAVGVLNDPKNTFNTDDLFRVYDGGILVAGGVSVDHGDFVSWDGTKWVLEAGVKMATSLDTAEISDIKELIPESASAENQLATVADIGAIKNGGTLTSDTAITVPNNASSFCAITEAAGDVTITVETEEDEVPNFAFTFTTVNDITISVEHDFGNQTDVLLYSVAGGNEAKAGKTYQLTCVGDCWTLAEFTAPTP